MEATLALSSRIRTRIALVLLLIAASACCSVAQSCDLAADLDASTKSAIQNAAQRYFTMSAQGDVAGLKANAIPQIAANFTSIEQAVVDNKKYFAEGTPEIAATYLLDASESKGTLQRADFTAVFTIRPNGWVFPSPTCPLADTQLSFNRSGATRTLSGSP